MPDARTLVALIPVLCAAALAVPYHLHMFQLCFYVPVEYGHWCRRTPEKMVPHLISVSNILMFLPGLTWSRWAAAILWAVANVCWMIVYFPRKAKKPLVFTPRAIRLTLTTALLALGLPAVLLPVSPIAARAAMALVFALVPLYLMAANLINKPIEASIRRGFIRDAQKRLAAQPDLVVIGVTGSYGKTSVKFFLGDLLNARFNTLVTPESYNTPMGVVKTIRERLSPTHEVFVCEMGAKTVGEIDEICRIVRPRHGVITSIGPQHLETFRSLENIQKTKFELADALPEHGLLFVNGDDENIAAHNHPKAAIRYGLDGSNDFRASDVSVSESGTRFTVTASTGESQSFTTRLLGEHNVINLTGAIAAAVTLGIPMTRLRLPVTALKPVPHRLELSGTPERLIIDDAFNSNPSGAEAALKTLALFDACRIIVTPGMIELGPRQDELNARFGEQIAKTCDHVFLVGKKQTQAIREGLERAQYPPEKIAVVSGVQEALRAADALPGFRKVILLENDLPDDY